jgi:hypothetical protein
VKAWPGLHSLGNDHVTIQRELRYLIAAQGVGTGMLTLRSGSNPAGKPRVYVGSG